MNLTFQKLNLDHKQKSVLELIIKIKKDAKLIDRIARRIFSYNKKPGSVVYYGHTFVLITPDASADEILQDFYEEIIHSHAAALLASGKADLYLNKKKGIYTVTGEFTHDIWRAVERLGKESGFFLTAEAYKQIKHAEATKHGEDDIFVVNSVKDNAHTSAFNGEVSKKDNQNLFAVEFTRLPSEKETREFLESLLGLSQENNLEYSGMLNTAETSLLFFRGGEKECLPAEFGIDLSSLIKENFKGVDYKGIILTETLKEYKTDDNFMYAGSANDRIAYILPRIPQEKLFANEKFIKRCSNIIESIIFPKTVGGLSDYEQRIYRILGIIKKQEAFHTPFIGRTRELNELVTLRGSLISEKVGGIVAITGSAGSGKSRLAREFWAKGIDNKKFIQKIYIKLTELDKDREYGLFIKLLKKILPDTPGETVSYIESISNNIKNKEGKNILKQSIFYMESLLGYPGINIEAGLNIEEWKTIVNLGFINLLKAISYDIPIIVVVDDFHLIDRESLQFFKEHYRDIKKSPILFILLTRDKIEGIPHFNFELKPLVDEEKIASAILGNPLSPELVKVFKKRTKGNPFFTEQLALYLKEKNAVKLNADSFVLNIAEEKIPENINAVILERISRLKNDTKYLLEVASVIGQEFAIDFLSTILKKKESFVLSISKELKKEELLDEISLKTGELFHIFKHALIKDAVYNSIVEKRKRQLHRIIVDTIEKVYADKIDRFYYKLIYHAREAGMIEKEKQYLNQLSRKTQAEFLFTETIQHKQRLLELEDSKEARIQIMKDLLSLYDLVGNWSELMNISKALREMANKIGDRKLEGFCLLKESGIMIYTGHIKDSIETAQKASQIFEQEKDDTMLVRSFIDIGNAHWANRELEKALEMYQKALDLKEKNNVQEDLCPIISNIGLIYLEKGDYENAEKHYKQAIEQCKTEKNYMALANSYNSIANIYAKTGNIKKAETYAMISTGICREKGLLHQMGRANLTLCQIYIEKGDMEKAEEFGTDALNIFRTSGDKMGSHRTLISLAQVMRKLKKYSLAEAHLHHSLEIAEESGDTRGKMQSLLEMGNLFGLQKRDKCLVYYNDAQKLALANNDREILRQAYLGMAYYFMGTINPAKAIFYFKEAMKYTEDPEEKTLIESKLKSLSDKRKLR